MTMSSIPTRKSSVGRAEALDPGCSTAGPHACLGHLNDRSLLALSLYGIDRINRPPKPPGAGNLALSPAAQAQSGRLVALEPGGAGGGQARQQADPALGRLCRLPLVPRDGARELRGRRHRRGDERPVRQHQSRPRGTARHRPDLHVGAAPDGRAWRLAADHVPDARTASRSGAARISRSRAATASRPSSTCCARSRACSARSRRASSRIAAR